MAHEAHAPEHGSAGPLGGILDGVAVGLGASMLICGLFAYNDHFPLINWIITALGCSAIGALAGAIWGNRRGY